MPFLIDTNVAIEWRDGTSAIIAAISKLADPPLISIITRIELEGGVYRDPSHAALRRSRLDLLLTTLPVLDLPESVADRYRDIIAATGFSRRRILDRLIAATAIVHGLTLITINGTDFADIPNLKLEIWPAPRAQ
ncbi:PIN domain-containing protein [Sphingomonas sp.]|uniref:PIN domain-containing protein n=1 Tax=Sphingomonas sp. TaxID=28214 RepID=UPI0033423E3B